MKKILKAALLLLALALCISALAACGDNPEPTPTPSGPEAWKPSGEEITIFTEGQPTSFVIAYADEESKPYAELFRSSVTKNGFAALSDPVSVSDASSDKLIVFGKSEHRASAIAEEKLGAAMKSASKKDLVWTFCYYDGVLAISANSLVAYEQAMLDFFKNYASDSKISFKDDLAYVKVMTEADYDAYLTAIEDAAAAEKKAEHALLLDDLIEDVEDQRKELSTVKGRRSKYNSNDPMVYLFSTHTENLGASSWGAPHAEPTANEHPKLLITRDMIPNIRASLREDNATNARFLKNVDAVIANDCILPAATGQGTNAQVGTSNIHNWDAGPLEIIQTKALAYLLYDDPYYGYQAIYYMKNYILSLDIKQIASDQCRQYGYVMFVAATVYDWCYDLLTEEDKIQFIAGVENCICRGSNALDVKMEVGFPPVGQGSVSGHGSEYQILRDYLAFAVAIYDENPSWWQNVAGRVYNDYLQVRNYYFQSGMTQQGTANYIAARHICDLYSAWILTVATGTNPYIGMENTTKSTLGYEFKPGYIFGDGDGTGDSVASTKFMAMAYITAYLYADDAMLAQGNYLIGSQAFGATYAGLASSAYVALHGLARLEANEDRYASMDLIQYNGFPLGQYIVREAWADDTSAAVFMRIKERSTANHEHLDSGTFQIYYKGMLTNDGGIYFNYSHPHTQYYQQATISHNGLIIFNPQKINEDSGWYSGGQKKIGSESQNLQDWLKEERMDTGKVTGRQHGYANSDKTRGKYAYIAGDITAAYDLATVNYVGRRMLTVYTDDEEFPMAFFVYDDIYSKNKRFEKRFLLQITSKNAPTIDGNTVITENGDGRLILTCLSEDVVINGVGGRNEGTYQADKSQNYLINGKQLAPLQNHLDDGHWGRVEIVYDKDSTNASFMNVIYVTDKGNENRESVEYIYSKDKIEGCLFGDSLAAVFVTSRERATEEISYKISGKSGAIEQYVSGVAAGKWTVTVNDTPVGTYEATEEGGLLIFTAPAGKVVITPVK